MGYSIMPFELSAHAASIHRMLEEAYAGGGGRVAGYAGWWNALRDDAEYDPSRVFVVGHRTGAAVAFAICWSSAFVKDLVVASEARRRRLATNLLRHIFCAFRARGAHAVDLKVEAGNAPAISLYRSAGMACVESLRAAR